MSVYFVIVEVFNKNSPSAQGKNRTCWSSSADTLLWLTERKGLGDKFSHLEAEEGQYFSLPRNLLPLIPKLLKKFALCILYLEVSTEDQIGLSVQDVSAGALLHSPQRQATPITLWSDKLFIHWGAVVCQSYLWSRGSGGTINTL